MKELSPELQTAIAYAVAALDAMYDQRLDCIQSDIYTLKYEHANSHIDEDTYVMRQHDIYTNLENIKEEYQAKVIQIVDYYTSMSMQYESVA